MPKTYPNSRKEQWLAQLLRGKTIKQIARNAKCDVRTVKRATEEIRNRRAAQDAMTLLYQEALRDHMNRLNSALEVIIEGLRLPDPYFTELAWTKIASVQIAEPENGEEGEDEKKGSDQNDDVLSDRALIAEHLKNNKAWRALGDWNRSLSKHRTACGILQMRSLEVMKKLTGLKACEELDVEAGPLLHAENTGDLLCRTVVRHLSGGHDIETVAKEITADGDRGFVLYGNTVLAEGIREFQKLSECQTSILESLKILKDSTEAMQVLNTYQQMRKTLPEARNALRTIQLLGVLPGKCRICRQLGL